MLVAFTTLNRVEKDAFVLNEVAFLFVKDVLDLWHIGCCFQWWKGSENGKKTKRLNEEEVKQQLIDSLMNNDTIETEELNEKAEKVDKAEDAADVIKEHEEIPRTKRKGFISVPYHQEKVFNRFCKKEKFMKLLNKFKIHKNKIVFKINVLKLINKHPVFCHFKFLKELFEGHQTNMSKKCKRIGKNLLFKKTFLKLRLQFLMPQKHSDKLYSKCCKIFKAYLTRRTVNFVLTHSS